MFGRHKYIVARPITTKHHVNCVHLRLDLYIFFLFNKWSIYIYSLWIYINFNKSLNALCYVIRALSYVKQASHFLNKGHYLCLLTFCVWRTNIVFLSYWLINELKASLVVRRRRNSWILLNLRQCRQRKPRRLVITLSLRQSFNLYHVFFIALKCSLTMVYNVAKANIIAASCLSLQ